METRSSNFAESIGADNENLPRSSEPVFRLHLKRNNESRRKGDAPDVEERAYRTAWHTRAKVESVVEGWRTGERRGQPKWGTRGARCNAHLLILLQREGPRVPLTFGSAHAHARARLPLPGPRARTRGGYVCAHTRAGQCVTVNAGH